MKKSKRAYTKKTKESPLSLALHLLELSQKVNRLERGLEQVSMVLPQITAQFNANLKGLDERLSKIEARFEDTTLKQETKPAEIN